MRYRHTTTYSVAGTMNHKARGSIEGPVLWKRPVHTLESPRSFGLGMTL
jgi:hypothetical protein